MIRTPILILIALIIIYLALRSLRAQRLKENYVLLFLFTGLPFLFFAAWPNAILWLEHVLEIEKATLLILMVALYFLLTTFALLSIVSVQDRKITTLAQSIALLEQRNR